LIIAASAIYEPCSFYSVVKIESTIRYLGIEVDDALAITEQIECLN
jgi:hypothetical protein